MAENKLAAQDDGSDDGGGVPEWVVTFGDMMSLLLTFFIMLFSMSEIKEDENYQAILEAIRQQFGYDASVSNPIPGKIQKPSDTVLAKLASLGRAKRANTMNGGDRVKAPVGEHPRVLIVRQGRQATTGGTVYFELGSDRLTDEDRATLAELATGLKGMANRIDIRGHTTHAPLPKDSPYSDHWDLAYARARAVAAFLEEHGVSPDRIRVSVAAANEPTEGDAATDMRRNARVEISSLDEIVKPSERRYGEDQADFPVDSTHSAAP